MKPDEKKEKLGKSVASIPSERLQRVRQLLARRRELKEQIRFLKRLLSRKRLLEERLEQLREEAAKNNAEKQKEEWLFLYKFQ